MNDYLRITDILADVFGAGVIVGANAVRSGESQGSISSKGVVATNMGFQKIMEILQDHDLNMTEQFYLVNTLNEHHSSE